MACPHIPYLLPGLSINLSFSPPRSITWGILIQYFIQFGCSYIDGLASWRIPWGLQMIPGMILGTGMLLLPESPRWLIDHDRESEALEILADLHGKGDPQNELVQLEFSEIVEQVEYERTEGAKSYLDLFKPGIFRRVTLGASLQMWSQLSGMNIMMYYIVYVFQGAGLTGRRGNLIASSVQYVLNVALTGTPDLSATVCLFLFRCLIGIVQCPRSSTSTGGAVGPCSSSAPA